MKAVLKKFLLVILTLTLVISLLSSCGANDANGNEETNGTTDTQGVDSTDNPTESTPQESEPEDTEPEDLYDFSGAASPQLEKIAKKIAESKKYLIFTVGDSVTQGQGASNQRTTDYTAMFAQKLGNVFTEKSIYRADGVPNGNWTGIYYPRKPSRIKQGTDGRITVARCGLGGDTVERVLKRTGDFINKEIDGETGNLFMICLGINDSWPGGPTPQVYQQRLGELVDKICEAHPDSDIILMTPTFVGDNSSNPLVNYANAMKELAISRDIAFIDLNAMFNEHYVAGAANYGQGDWLADNCHPSDVGYEAIADEMIRCLFGIEAE